MKSSVKAPSQEKSLTSENLVEACEALLNSSLKTESYCLVVNMTTFSKATQDNTLTTAGGSSMKVSDPSGTTHELGLAIKTKKENLHWKDTINLLMAHVEDALIRASYKGFIPVGFEQYKVYITEDPTNMIYTLSAKVKVIKYTTKGKYCREPKVYANICRQLILTMSDILPKIRKALNNLCKPSQPSLTAMQGQTKLNYGEQLAPWSSNKT